eukprot:g3333.t1
MTFQDIGCISDPGKSERVFQVTLNSSQRFVVKTGRFRGPLLVQIFIACANLFRSREKIFYDYNNQVMEWNCNIASCLYAAEQRWLTHTFFIFRVVESEKKDLLVRSFTEGSTNVSLSLANLFLCELAKLHAQYYNKNNVLDTIFADGWWLKGFLTTSLPKRHRKFALLALQWVENNANWSVIHGDARLGNALFFCATPSKAKICTLLDWECASSGPIFWDIIYFIWLSLPAQSAEKDEDILWSHRDRKIIKQWSELIPNFTGPSPEEACILSILMWCYMICIGESGFGYVWRDGNNADDLEAWRKRVRSRIHSLAKNQSARQLVISALSQTAPNEEVKDLFDDFVQTGLRYRIWTE